MKFMLGKRLNSSGYGHQLRWVILLLAVAVILPTVCLLWFMSQAVKNVELAARQKLMAVYEDNLAKASQETNQSWSEKFEQLDKAVDQNLPSDVFDNLFRAHYHSVIVYDEDGRRIYPLISADVKVPVDPAEQFRDAWRLEFAEQKLTEAIKLYEEKTRSNNTYVRLSALIGKARCLTKLGNSDNATEVCKKVALSPEAETCDTATLMLIANARLLLTELTKPTLRKPETLETLTYPVFRDELSKLFQIIRGQNKAGSVLPLDQSVFLARRSTELARGADTVYYEVYRDMPMVMYDMDMELEMDIESLTGLRNEGQFTLSAIERFPTAAELEDWPNDQFRQMQLDRETICYGLKRYIDGRTMLFLQPSGHNTPLGFGYQYNFRGTGVTCRILDNLGRAVNVGAPHRGRPFIRVPIGGYFADWQAELYFIGDDIFERTARRQIATYIWAGVLVIVLILAAGGFAGQAVSKQVKLNKLKNDFVATASHELKTPLASMRVLVDTLLEGNYKDQRQAREYLKLTARENERLSGLINNFLTFSRMERNKQAFEIVKTSAAAIARDAVEAVKTEFTPGKCELEVQISEDLPNVPADHDAMVTVLVNLLDNAYKYSPDDKRIKLRVFAEDDSVSFAVSDNGVGISRKNIRKIFRRFYQADRSLARHAEGCGLGLSIAKFIVDAHKGSISVDSKPGEGSTFTVKLPAVN